MPGEMTVDEAFRLLRIAPKTTAADATKAYHSLSKRAHPDLIRGDTSEQARLNEAHALVLEHLRGKQLVPLQVKRAVEVLERGLERQQATLEAASFTAATV